MQGCLNVTSIRELLGGTDLCWFQKDHYANRNVETRSIGQTYVCRISKTSRRMGINVAYIIQQFIQNDEAVRTSNLKWPKHNVFDSLCVTVHRETYRLYPRWYETEMMRTWPCICIFMKMPSSALIWLIAGRNYKNGYYSINWKVKYVTVHSHWNQGFATTKRVIGFPVC